MSLWGQGSILWKTGGDEIRCLLVCTDAHYPSSSEVYLSEIPEFARIGNDNGSTGADGVELTLLEPTQGYLDAADILFSNITSGSDLDAIIFYKYTGSDATSPLLIYLDDLVDVPYNPDGELAIGWGEYIARL